MCNKWRVEIDESAQVNDKGCLVKTVCDVLLVLMCGGSCSRGTPVAMCAQATTTTN